MSLLRAVLLVPPLLLLNAGREAPRPAERPARAVVEGRAIPADGGVVVGLVARLRTPGFADTARVGPTGEFSLRRPAAEPGVAVEILIDAVDPAFRRYHPAAVRISPADLDEPQGVVLVPTRWLVRGGSYAGAVVEISPSAAFTPACRGCTSFYRQWSDAPGAAPRPRVQSWPEEVHPLRVAFDEPEGRRAGIGSRDSVAFWRILERMERDYGRNLFYPARHAEVESAETGLEENVVLIRIEPGMRAPGWGSAIAQRGDIFYGAAAFRSPGVFSGLESDRLVTHEMMHVLGFGHTCSWRSAMAQVPQCAGLRSSTLTREDVAHAQVLTRLRSLQRQHGARWGMDAALAGERGRP